MTWIENLFAGDAAVADRGIAVKGSTVCEPTGSPVAVEK
jgi:hypothetical protein